MNTYVPTPGPPPLAFGKERPKLSAQSWVYWGATGFVKGPQEPVGAVGVTRQDSRRCGRRGTQESPCRRACPLSPGSWFSPAAGPLPEAVQLVTKSPPGRRCPGCGTQEPAQLLGLSASRAMSPGSRRWGAAAGGRGAGAGREAGASLLAARGSRGAGASHLPHRRAASRPFPGAAPGLQLQEIEARPRLPNPGFLRRTRRAPGSYPRCPEALCEEAEETRRFLLLIKTFYKCAFLENFAEFEVLATSSHPFSCSWSLSSSAVNISTIGADQGWTFCNWKCNLKPRRDCSQDGQKVLWNGVGWN